jgi:osmoprotectant transport system substrate-binding protein
LTARPARLAAAALVLSIATACTSDPTRTNNAPPEDAIRVGSFDFNESKVLAEIYARAMDDAGYPAIRVTNAASREIMQPALQQDHVDFLPEYLGTSLNFATLGSAAVPKEASAARDLLAETLADEGVAVMDYSPAEDVNEVVVLTSTAEEHNLESISDLKVVDEEFVFGGPPECLGRETCLLGLEEVYGLDFESFLSLDPGGPLTVSALKGGEADVGVLFSTSPALADLDFHTLKDDLRLQPPENIVPVISSAVLEENAGLDVIIDSVSSKLSTAELRRMNGLVDAGTLSASDAAQQWLELEGIL